MALMIGNGVTQVLTLIYKFKDELIEGKVYSFHNMGVSTNGEAYRTTHHRYKLNFQFGSLIQRLSSVDVVRSPFHFVPIYDVVGGSYDIDYLGDVIGVLTNVGSEREITNQNGTTTKLNVIALEAEGHKLQCILLFPSSNIKLISMINTFLLQILHFILQFIILLLKFFNHISFS
ncbi:hypothetical protein P8452_44988 [Trifolium repens]|nr:hypothetical protein P8452_44988 [Trifolium repens]